MYPHRIRLRGPWICQPLTSDGDPVGNPKRMTMPCRWRDAGLGDFPGRVRFARRFGYPGRIDDYERVWLTLEEWHGIADIILNDEILGKHLSASETPVEFDVTSLLDQRNMLFVDLVDETNEAGLTGEIALEIRCSAYLKNVNAKRSANGIEVSGELVGACERPLELYLLCNGVNAGYEELATSTEGRPFQFTIADPSSSAPNSVSIRLELVNVSTVWYAVELSV